ncbi:MAG: VCBS repeat-containing protein [Sedimentisphaerales bacterium]|nr:VCBS repeat-containing protein [Sedimentisphaerales bacterium]
MNRKLLSQVLVIGVVTAACTVRAADEGQLIAVLQSNAGAVEKCDACRQLRIVGTAESVPALAALLPDERVGHAARYALEGMPHAEAGTALREAIGKTSGPVKAGLIDSVGWRGDTRAVGLLIPLLSDGDAAVATAAAAALGRIGGDDAEPALAAACEKSKGETGIAAAEALLKCAERRLSASDDVQAAGLYRKVMAAAPSPAIRAAAWRGLVLSDGERRGVLVVDVLGGDDEVLRPVAFKLVRETEDKQLVKTCMQNWRKLPADAQVLLIDVMSARGDRASLTDIVKACSSPEEAVRIGALKAVGVLGGTADVALLVELAARASGGEQAAATASLRTMKGAKINSALVARLKRGDNADKVVVCRALLERNAVESAPALVEAARTNGGAVRAEALKALRDLAGKDEIGALVDLVFVVEPSRADEVGKVLSSLARRNSVQQECTEAILSKYKGARSDGQRVALLMTLGGLGDETALPTLRESLKTGSSDVRYAAIKALSIWPNAAAAGDLVKVVESTDNRTHCILALRGYVDLIDSASLPANQKLEHYRRAMQLADQEAEKKKVLSSLGSLATLGAFQMAAASVDDAALKNEAALAACVIAEKLDAAQGRQIKNDLETIVAADLSDSTRERAWDILGKIVQAKRYVTEWEVSGPYFEEGKNYSVLFDTAFAPEIDGGKDTKWQKMPAGTDEAQPYYLDLLKALNGGEQRVAYLRTKLQWPKEQQVKLWIGSDDGYKIWINGQLAASNNVARPFVIDQDNAEAKLKGGENAIMMKVTQNNLPWGASLAIEEPRPPKPPKMGKGFNLHVVNAESAFEAAGVCDINKDGKLDIFTGGFWYESPSWEKHFVREVEFADNYYYDFASLPMDVDGDGWVDVVSAAWHNKKVFWTRNPGDAGGKFEVFDVDTPGNMETAISVDINGDGQLDILPNIMTAAAWYEYKPDAAAPGGAKWTKHDLPQPIAGHGIGAGDVNGDGRCDILAPNGWAEQESDGKWQWRAEFGLGATSIPILAHDVDGDGDSDIIWGMGHNYGVFWLEQGKDGDGKRTWAKHEIDSQWSQPHFLVFADLDKDGDDELITGKRVYAHNGHDPGGTEPPCVYYYSFDKAAKKWSRHILHEGGKVGFGINTQVIDIDGDGDIDIVAPGKTGLYLFENILVE